MPITTSDFPTLTGDVQEIFNETAKTKVAEMVGNQIFDVKDTDRLTFEHLILHGINGIKKVTPGQDLPRINAEEGDTISYTQEYFGGIASITKKMRKFDLHNQIEQVVKSLVTDAFDLVDQSMADLLTGGYLTSYQDAYGETVSAVGPDGLALFSTSHSNNLNSNVFSNIITSNPTLSREAIVTARAQGRAIKDPAGKIRPVNLDTLVVSGSNEDLAERIVNSNNISGSANNDLNTLKGKVKKVIVWDRLATRSDGTDTSAYWFMLDSTKIAETLKCLFAERPSLDAPDQVYANKNWDYSCDFFYVLGRGYMPYIFGSNASGS